MRNSNRTVGYGILELLVVIAIIGILAVIALPNFLHARDAAQDRSAESYAGSVYKVAFAYISEDLTAAVVTDPDCTDGYVAGSYDVDPPGGVVNSCAVTIAGDGTPVVTVASISGRTITLSN